MCDIRNFVFVCVRGVSKIINLCAVCDEFYLFGFVCVGGVLSECDDGGVVL